MRRAVACLACAVVVGGCGATTGVRDEGPKVQEIVGDQVDLTEDVDVYFVRYGGPAAVQRVVAPGTSLSVEREAVRALLEGPTAEERAARYASAFPDGAKLVNLTVNEGAATVDLVGRFEPIQRDKFTDTGPGARRRQALLEEIVYTLTAFPDITSVQVSLNSEPTPLVQTFEGAGLTRELIGAVAGRFADQAVCASPARLPRNARPLRLVDPLGATVASDGFVHFRAVTTRKEGQVVVQLVQDGRVVRNVDQRELAYNQPDAPTPSPCARFSGAMELPWGVTGAATFRIVIRPGPSGGEQVAVERDITIEEAEPGA